MITFKVCNERMKFGKITSFHYRYYHYYLSISIEPFSRYGHLGIIYLFIAVIYLYNLFIEGQDSTMVRFLRIDPMVSGSSPPSAELSLRVRRVASSL